uniref:30S ribosomal protein S19 n=1 Tax=Nephromyces sp. ex Molgula occidentalis TaxID=2544991 RepID=A0A5C1H810_9APIC|nr:30S ribosomal protein S19 [Nephromyces sp. ex Molgula occidentalis]
MVKTLIKYPFIDKSIIRKLQSINNSKIKYKLFSKSSIIPNIFKFKHILIYNGYNFISLNLTFKKVKYKLGMFIFTRKIKMNN